MAGLTGARPSRPRAVAAAAVLLALAAALAALALEQGYGPHDEGLMLQWASRTAAGEWQYRDFWSNYAPGQPLLLAALWKAFGPSLVTWRLVRVAVDAVAALLAFLLVRREARAGTWWALGAWAGVAAAMAWPAGPGPMATATLLAFAAALAAPRAPVVAGALAGAAVFVRPEVGLAAAAGAALCAPSRGASARVLVAAALVTLAAFLPFAVLAGGELPRQLLGFGAIQHLQRLPLVPDGAWTTDPNKALERLFPLLLVGATLVYAAALALARPPRRALWPAPLVAVGLVYLLARSDEFHLVPLAPALAAGLATVGPYVPVRAARWLVAAPLAVIVLHGLDRKIGQLRGAAPQAAVPARVAGGVTTSRADAAALARVLPAVRRMTAGGAPVLVVPPRSDRVRVGDPMLNVLLERPNPTRYDVVQPGVTTTARVQREMVAALRRTRTPVVVRWTAPTARALEPNGSARSSGVRVLDDEIARRYRTVARYGDYVVLVRRGPV